MIKDNIRIENAVVINRNFAGRPGKYNERGERQFSVELDADTAQVLANDGWPVNVKTNPEDPDEDPRYFMGVKVKYNEYGGPKIIQITRRGNRIIKTPITEDTVALIDNAEIKNIDLELRPYNWKTSTGEGTKPYLKTMYYELIEDPFAHKYDDFTEDISSLPYDEE